MLTAHLSISLNFRFFVNVDIDVLQIRSNLVQNINDKSDVCSTICILSSYSKMHISIFRPHM